MTTMTTLTAVTTHLALAAHPTRVRGQAIRRLADKWRAALSMTPQERAAAYVARMPTAVIAR